MAKSLSHCAFHLSVDSVWPNRCLYFHKTQHISKTGSGSPICHCLVSFFRLLQSRWQRVVSSLPHCAVRCRQTAVDQTAAFVLLIIAALPTVRTRRSHPRALFRVKILIFKQPAAGGGRRRHRQSHAPMPAHSTDTGAFQTTPILSISPLQNNPTEIEIIETKNRRFFSTTSEWINKHQNRKHTFPLSSTTHLSSR